MTFNLPRCMHRLHRAALACAAGGFVLPVLILGEGLVCDWRIFFNRLLVASLPASIPIVRLLWMRKDGPECPIHAGHTRQGRSLLILASAFMFVAMAGQLASITQIIWLIWSSLNYPAFGERFFGAISLPFFSVLTLLGSWLTDVVHLRQYQQRDPLKSCPAFDLEPHRERDALACGK